ncbi:MAG: hypothetical protein HFG51_04375 [Lachnospiraceae bacterium]|nr:hypothetical protein [Lachnospiraceae bacterium]
MKNWKSRGQVKDKGWNEAINKELEAVDEEAAKEVSQDAIARVVSFMREDDETFFRRSVQGLSLSEIEEFLKACPEFRPFWNQDKNGC